MINIRIHNPVANVGIRNFISNLRLSNFQTTRSGEPLIATGTPLGLLLALTYADNQNPGPFGDDRPNVRITNN